MSALVPVSDTPYNFKHFRPGTNMNLPKYGCEFNQSSAHTTIMPHVRPYMYTLTYLKYVHR